MEKQCAKCKETKSVTCFTRQVGRAMGVGSYCKPCKNESSKITRNLLWEANAMVPTYPPHWEKKCCMCKEYKPRIDFHLFRKSPDGYMSQCKNCSYKSARAWSKRNPEHNRFNAKQNKKRRRAALKEMSKADKKEAKAHLKAIKDNPCFYCGGFSEEMHDDHYYPFSKGGTNHAINFVKACQPCNQTKYNRCGTWMILKRGNVNV